MTDSTIYVNEVAESLGRVWVHIQDVDEVSCVTYRVRMSYDTVDFVIGPDDKVPSMSWDQHLREEVGELGSFMLSIYFQKLRQLSDIVMQQPRWVIATLDAVIEDAHGIELQGRSRF